MYVSYRDRFTRIVTAHLCNQYNRRLVYELFHCSQISILQTTIAKFLKVKVENTMLNKPFAAAIVTHKNFKSNTLLTDNQRHAKIGTMITTKNSFWENSSTETSFFFQLSSRTVLLKIVFQL